MVNKKNRKEHICPTCGTNDLVIIEDYSYDESARYDYFSCNVCNEEGLNVHRLKFDKQLTAKELGWEENKTTITTYRK